MSAVLENTVARARPERSRTACWLKRSHFARKPCFRCVASRMQRIRCLCQYSVGRPRRRFADLRLPGHTGALCNEATRLVEPSPVLRGLLVRKCRTRAPRERLDLFDLLPPQSGRHWRRTSDALVLRQLPLALGRHALSPKAGSDPPREANTFGNSKSAAG